MWKIEVGFVVTGTVAFDQPFVYQFVAPYFYVTTGGGALV